MNWAAEVGLVEMAVKNDGQVRSEGQRLRDDKKIQVIAALLAAWPGAKIPSGKDLEKSAASVGVSISDDTIRKAFKAANEIAPSLNIA